MASISETNSPSSKKGEGEWPTGAEHYILNKDKDLIGKGAFANVYRAYCNPRIIMLQLNHGLRESYQWIDRYP